MPLPNLAALPFLPFLKPGAFGFAYLYGLAALLALAAAPLRHVFCRLGLVRFRAAAPVMLAWAAFLLGPTAWSDLTGLPGNADPGPSRSKCRTHRNCAPLQASSGR